MGKYNGINAVSWRPGRDSKTSVASLCRPPSICADEDQALASTGRQRDAEERRWLDRKLDTATALCILSLLLLSTPLHAQSVYWNPVNSVGSGHEALIEFAAWSASERVGAGAAYAGQTNASECVSGSITVRTAVIAEWVLAGNAAGFDPSPDGPHGWTFTCPYGGFTILLSPHHPVSRITVLHELVCHGLRGFGPPGDPNHLLFSTGALCLFHPPVDALITTVDADYIRNSPDWPVPNAPSFCHNELANDFDLQIPQINGKRVRLNYDGIVGGSHQWTTAENLTQSNTKGCANNWFNNDGSVTLNDVRGLAQDFSSATFEPIGLSSWRLISTTP